MNAFLTNQGWSREGIWSVNRRRQSVREKLIPAMIDCTHKTCSGLSNDDVVQITVLIKKYLRTLESI